MGIVPISVGYIQPGLVYDIGMMFRASLSTTDLVILTCPDADAFNAHTEKLFGYSTYGYWPWHNTEEAIQDCDYHVFYTETLELSKAQ